jgi:ADP-ribose pyrophosphatase
MSFEEKTIESKLLFTGRILSARLDTVLLPNGGMSTREIIDHDPAVVILPFNSEHEVFLIRQYRKPLEAVIWEAPAGMIEPGENTLDAAKRELREETGFEAKQWHYVGQAYPAPGFCNELLHFYLAEGLSKGATHFDSDEYIETKKMSLSDLMNLVLDGSIVDAKTQLMAFHLQRFFL